MNAEIAMTSCYQRPQPRNGVQSRRESGPGRSNPASNTRNRTAAVWGRTSLPPFHPPSFFAGVPLTGSSGQNSKPGGLGGRRGGERDGLQITPVPLYTSRNQFVSTAYHYGERSVSGQGPSNCNEGRLGYGPVTSQDIVLAGGTWPPGGPGRQGPTVNVLRHSHETVTSVLSNCDGHRRKPLPGPWRDSAYGFRETSLAGTGSNGLNYGKHHAQPPSQIKMQFDDGSRFQSITTMAKSCAEAGSKYPRSRPDSHSLSGGREGDCSFRSSGNARYRQYMPVRKVGQTEGPLALNAVDCSALGYLKDDETYGGFALTPPPASEFLTTDLAVLSSDIHNEKNAASRGNPTSLECLLGFFSSIPGADAATSCLYRVDDGYLPITPTVSGRVYPGQNSFHANCPHMGGYRRLDFTPDQVVGACSRFSPSRLPSTLAWPSSTSADTSGALFPQRSPRVSGGRGRGRRSPTVQAAGPRCHITGQGFEEVIVGTAMQGFRQQSPGPLGNGSAEDGIAENVGRIPSVGRKAYREFGNGSCNTASSFASDHGNHGEGPFEVVRMDRATGGCSSLQTRASGDSQLEPAYGKGNGKIPSAWCDDSNTKDSEFECRHSNSRPCCTHPSPQRSNDGEYRLRVTVRNEPSGVGLRERHPPQDSQDPLNRFGREQDPGSFQATPVDLSPYAASQASSLFGCNLVWNDSVIPNLCCASSNADSSPTVLSRPLTPVSAHRPVGPDSSYSRGQPPHSVPGQRDYDTSLSNVDNPQRRAPLLSSRYCEISHPLSLSSYSQPPGETCIGAGNSQSVIDSATAIPPKLHEDSRLSSTGPGRPKIDDPGSVIFREAGCDNHGVPFSALDTLTQDDCHDNTSMPSPLPRNVRARMLLQGSHLDPSSPIAGEQVEPSFKIVPEDIKWILEDETVVEFLDKHNGANFIWFSRVEANDRVATLHICDTVGCDVHVVSVHAPRVAPRGEGVGDSGEGCESASPARGGSTEDPASSGTVSLQGRPALIATLGRAPQIFVDTLMKKLNLDPRKVYEAMNKDWYTTGLRIFVSENQLEVQYLQARKHAEFTTGKLVHLTLTTTIGLHEVHFGMPLHPDAIVQLENTPEERVVPDVFANNSPLSCETVAERPDDRERQPLWSRAFSNKNPGDRVQDHSASIYWGTAGHPVPPARPVDQSAETQNSAAKKAANQVASPEPAGGKPCSSDLITTQPEQRSGLARRLDRVLDFAARLGAQLPSFLSTATGELMKLVVLDPGLVLDEVSLWAVPTLQDGVGVFAHTSWSNAPGFLNEIALVSPRKTQNIETTGVARDSQAVDGSSRASRLFLHSTTGQSVATVQGSTRLDTENLMEHECIQLKPYSSKAGFMELHFADLISQLARGELLSIKQVSRCAEGQRILELRGGLKDPDTRERYFIYLQEVEDIRTVDLRCCTSDEEKLRVLNLIYSADIPASQRAADISSYTPRAATPTGLTPTAKRRFIPLHGIPSLDHRGAAAEFLAARIHGRLKVDLRFQSRPVDAASRLPVAKSGELSTSPYCRIHRLRVPVNRGMSGHNTELEKPAEESAICGQNSGVCTFVADIPTRQSSQATRPPIAEESTSLPCSPLDTATPSGIVEAFSTDAEGYGALQDGFHFLKNSTINTDREDDTKDTVAAEESAVTLRDSNKRKLATVTETFSSGGGNPPLSSSIRTVVRMSTGLLETPGHLAKLQHTGEVLSMSLPDFEDEGELAKKDQCKALKSKAQDDTWNLTEIPTVRSSVRDDSRLDSQCTCGAGYVELDYRTTGHWIPLGGVDLLRLFGPLEAGSMPVLAAPGAADGCNGYSPFSIDPLGMAPPQAAFGPRGTISTRLASCRRTVVAGHVVLPARRSQLETAGFRDKIATEDVEILSPAEDLDEPRVAPLIPGMQVSPCKGGEGWKQLVLFGGTQRSRQLRLLNTNFSKGALGLLHRNPGMIEADTVLVDARGLIALRTADSLTAELGLGFDTHVAHLKRNERTKKIYLDLPDFWERLPNKVAIRISNELWLKVERDSLAFGRGNRTKINRNLREEKGIFRKQQVIPVMGARGMSRKNVLPRHVCDSECDDLHPRTAVSGGPGISKALLTETNCNHLPLAMVCQPGHSSPSSSGDNPTLHGASLPAKPRSRADSVSLLPSVPITSSVSGHCKVTSGPPSRRDNIAPSLGRLLRTTAAGCPKSFSSSVASTPVARSVAEPFFPIGASPNRRQRSNGEIESTPVVSPSRPLARYPGNDVRGLHPSVALYESPGLSRKASFRSGVLLGFTPGTSEFPLCLEPAMEVYLNTAANSLASSGLASNSRVPFHIEGGDLVRCEPLLPAASHSSFSAPELGQRSTGGFVRTRRQVDVRDSLSVQPVCDWATTGSLSGHTAVIVPSNSLAIELKAAGRYRQQSLHCKIPATTAGISRRGVLSGHQRQSPASPEDALVSLIGRTSVEAADVVVSDVKAGAVDLAPPLLRANGHGSVTHRSHSFDAVYAASTTGNMQSEISDFGVVPQMRTGSPDPGSKAAAPQAQDLYTVHLQESPSNPSELPHSVSLDLAQWDLADGADVDFGAFTFTSELRGGKKHRNKNCQQHQMTRHEPSRSLKCNEQPMADDQVATVGAKAREPSVSSSQAGDVGRSSLVIAAPRLKYPSSVANIRRQADGTAVFYTEPMPAGSVGVVNPATKRATLPFSDHSRQDSINCPAQGIASAVSGFTHEKKSPHHQAAVSAAPRYSTTEADTFGTVSFHDSRYCTHGRTPVDTNQDSTSVQLSPYGNDHRSQQPLFAYPSLEPYCSQDNWPEDGNVEISSFHLDPEEYSDSQGQSCYAEGEGEKRQSDPDGEDGEDDENDFDDVFEYHDPHDGLHHLHASFSVHRPPDVLVDDELNGRNRASDSLVYKGVGSSSEYGTATNQTALAGATIKEAVLQRMLRQVMHVSHATTMARPPPPPGFVVVNPQVDSVDGEDEDNQGTTDLGTSLSSGWLRAALGRWRSDDDLLVPVPPASSRAGRQAEINPFDFAAKTSGSTATGLAYYAKRGHPCEGQEGPGAEPDVTPPNHKQTLVDYQDHQFGDAARLLRCLSLYTNSLSLAGNPQHPSVVPTGAASSVAVNVCDTDRLPAIPASRLGGLNHIGRVATNHYGSSQSGQYQAFPSNGHPSTGDGSDWHRHDDGGVVNSFANLHPMATVTPLRSGYDANASSDRRFDCEVADDADDDDLFGEVTGLPHAAFLRALTSAAASDGVGAEDYRGTEAGHTGALGGTPLSPRTTSETLSAIASRLFPDRHNIRNRTPYAFASVPPPQEIERSEGRRGLGAPRSFVPLGGIRGFQVEMVPSDSPSAVSAIDSGAHPRIQPSSQPRGQMEHR